MKPPTQDGPTQWRSPMKGSESMSIRLVGRGRRAAAVLAAAVTVAALTVWPAGPASAVAAPRLVEVESAGGTEALKTAKAWCNDDEDVYGSGYYVRNGNGRVAINRVYIQHQLGYVEVEAQVTDEGLSTGWSMVAQAICGPRVEGLHRELKDIPKTTNRNQSARVECANGKAYGGGFIFTGSAGNVFVNRMVLDSSQSGVTVMGSVDNSVATAPSWGITVYVVCGPPAATMVRRQTATFEQSSSAQKDEDVQCLSGTQAHGAGLIVGITSASDLGNIVADQARITTPTLPVTSRVQAFENNSTSGTWYVRAQLICAT
jgi:hypothetical protein